MCVPGGMWMGVRIWGMQDRAMPANTTLPSLTPALALPRSPHGAAAPVPTARAGHPLGSWCLGVLMLAVLPTGAAGLFPGAFPGAAFPGAASAAALKAAAKAGECWGGLGKAGSGSPQGCPMGIGARTDFPGTGAAGRS